MSEESAAQRILSTKVSMSMSRSPSPSQGASRAREETPRLANEEHTPLLRTSNELRSPSPVPLSLPPPPPSIPWTQRVRETAMDIWLQGKGMTMVMMSQFFGSSMNAMTKVLELEGRDGKGFKPFQILVARMSITVIASYLYMWYTQVPQPFGTRSTFCLLLVRAVGGFWGIYGLYYSVQYLPLSEATVLTFLAPILSCYACSIFIPGEVFTRKQQLAGFVSFLGVVLIARPFGFLQSGEADNASSVEVEQESPGDADQKHRVLAVIMALVGVLGATATFTSIRMIGQRCHPLVSVTYFSLFTTVVSAIAIIADPSISFELPGTLLEWTLLVALGVCGFLLLFLQTAGLSYVPPPARPRDRATDQQPFRAASQHFNEDSPSKSEAEAPVRSSSGTKATTMVYTQMLFALFYDSVVWGSTLSAMSWMGSALILSSALYVAIAGESPAPSHADNPAPSEENAGERTR